MDNPYASGGDVTVHMLYLWFVLLMIVGWLFLLFRVSEISKNIRAIAEQQESQSRSLESLAESVAFLAKNSVAQKPAPPAPVVQ